MEFQGSRTQANLMAAYAGESQARNKYTYYASQAKKDGYEQIARIFTETAHNEKEHAELWFKQLHGGQMPSTIDNLKEAAAGEHYEWETMYADFAKTAREEGFHDIAAVFEMVAKIESFHEKRYLTLLDNIQSGKVFSRPAGTVWICLNCGHMHTGENPPEICPTCKHPKAYFQLHVADY